MLGSNAMSATGPCCWACWGVYASIIHQQLAQLSNFLEDDDNLLLNAQVQETEVTPEAEMRGTQGQSVL